MDPTAPGRPSEENDKKHYYTELKKYIPLIITANRANPLYRETNRSSIMPVAELMAIAPNSGDQPCVISGRT